MYLIQNALKNLARNKGRYLLIGAVLMAMLAAVTAAAMIHFTAKAAIDDYAHRFGAAVTFTPDLRKLIALMTPDENGYYHDPEITAAQYIAFSKSDALKSTRFQGSRQTYCATLTGLDQGGEESYYASGQDTVFTASAPHPESARRQAPNTLLLGYSDTSMLEDFALGLRELDEGRFFSANGECLVSRDLADLNHLKLGDSFDLQDVNNADVPPLRLTVCGIYLDVTTARSDGREWAVNNRRNEILTSFATLADHSMAGLNLSATYYLKTPDLAAQFESDARENGLNEIYHVNVDADGYNRIVKPVESLKDVSAAFLFVILLVGSAILILLSMLGVRERKYEIGVLRAMGMTKGKAAFGLICESVCVMLLCLCVGLGGGRLIAQPVSDAILSNMAKQDAGLSADTQPNFGDGVMMSAAGTEDASAQAVKVSLAPESVGLIAVAAIILCLLTNIFGIFYVMRYEPMKILTERS